MRKDIIERILQETRVFVKDGRYDVHFGNEFDRHEWYTVDEAEAIVEHALTLTQHYNEE